MPNVMSAIVNASKTKSMSSPVDNRGGWWPFIREPYSGAWQKNDEWSVDTVLAYHAVYACITLISSDIGKLPFKLTKLGSNGIWKDIADPKYSNLLKRPNHYQNHIQFKQWWIMSKLVRGNTYGLKIRASNGDIKAIYVLDPARVTPLVSPNGSVFYQLNQDNLNGLEQASEAVPASEIIHDRMDCLFHPLVGISPLFASGLAASHGLKIQNDSSNFFSNGSNPGGVLTAPGAISDETAQRLKTHWDLNYTGENAGKVAVLGDGLKFEAMRMSAADSQLIEQLKWSAEVVCSTFHVPPYMVGIGAMPSFNNIEALVKQYYGQCLQILIESMELCLDDGLDLPPGTGTELDLDVLFRMDSATMIDALGKGIGSALYSPDEARAKMNLPPVEGGSTPYLQQQNYSLAALAKRDAMTDPFSPTPAPGPIVPEGPEPTEEDTEDQARMFALLLQKELSVAKYS